MPERAEIEALRAAAKRVLEADMRGVRDLDALNALEDAAGFSQQGQRRSPQGEDHEARVETVARILGRGGWRDEDGVWHEGITVRDWSRAADIVAALDDLSRVPPSRDGTVAAEDMRAQAIAEAVQRLRQRAALWHGGEVEAAVVDECADFIEREFGSARAGESNEGGNRP